MNSEHLVQRAAQMARAKASAGSGRQANIRDVSQPGTGIERQSGKRGALARRLAAYHELLLAAKDEDPLCPDCWIGHEHQLAMTPIACETLDEVQFGCMECGFEAFFPARARTYWAHPDRHRKPPRAA